MKISASDWMRLHTSGWLWAAVTIFAFLSLVNGIQRGGQSFTQAQKLADYQSHLRERLARMDRENQRLSEEIHKIRTSPHYAAKILKEQYHEVKPGEEFIFVQPLSDEEEHQP